MRFQTSLTRLFIATFLTDESTSKDEDDINNPVIRWENDEMEEIESFHAENIECSETRSKEEVVEIEKEDAKAKVSTGCGPSPDRELKAFTRDEVHPWMSEKGSKVSTGCGTSPDREIEEIFANERVDESMMKSFTPLRDNPSRSSRVSIGTSPPPQSTSTQVCC